MPTLRSWIAPIAEDVARAIGESATPPVLVGTRLRGDELSRSKDEIRTGRRAQPLQGRTPRSVRCRVCGILLENPERAICDECLPGFDAERGAKLAAAGKAMLAAMRASGEDPAHSEAARAKRAATSRTTSLAARAWERERASSVEGLSYKDDVLPRIRELTVPRLVALTGLSQYHCWKVRKGERRLHARHWATITAEV